MIFTFTYRENSVMKWLTALFLAMSCFAFSVSPVPANARQPLPAQVEQVVSKKDDESVSLHHSARALIKSITTERLNEHEKNILLVHQNELDVIFTDLSKKFRSLPTPFFHHLRKIPAQDSKEAIPPFSAG